MTDTETAQVQQIRELISPRIRGLVRRGELVCAEWVAPQDGDGRAACSCKRCGYEADVHLLKQVLALLDAAKERK